VAPTITTIGVPAAASFLTATTRGDGDVEDDAEQDKPLVVCRSSPMDGNGNGNRNGLVLLPAAAMGGERTSVVILLARRLVM
jgi:hypothetical protein